MITIEESLKALIKLRAKVMLHHRKYLLASCELPNWFYFSPGKKVMIEYECPGFCPADCGPNEIQCRQVDDKGCDLPGQCISAMSKLPSFYPNCPL